MRQVESLWDRLTNDPRYHLATDPQGWLQIAFRREAAAMVVVECSSEESTVPVPGRGSSHASGVGKRTLAQDVPIGNAPSPSELPFRADVEALLGASLGEVRAYTHQDALLAPHGARAAAFRGGIAFAGAPTKEVVAHEAVHVLQLKTQGVTTNAGAAEAQAEGAARAMARGTRRIAISYVPTAAVSFDKGSHSDADATVGLSRIVGGALHDVQTRGVALEVAFDRQRELDSAIRASASAANVGALHQALVEGIKVIATFKVNVQLAGNQQAEVTVDDLLRLFAKIYLGPGLEAFGLPTSFGNDIAIGPLAHEISDALDSALKTAVGLSDARQAGTTVRSIIQGYQPIIEAAIESIATEYRDPAELVELELRGAMAELRTLRAKLAQTRDPQLGRTIAHLARYILLLSRRLGSLDQRLQAASRRGAEGAPHQQLEAAAGDIQAARAPIGSESETLQNLGNQSSLLTPQVVESHYDPSRPGKQAERKDQWQEQIPPEEAFAHHTDATMAQAQDRIASTSASQERELAAMKKALVPDKIATRTEFLVVYERWFGFFSKVDRDANWGPFLQFIEATLQLMPLAGSSGLMAMYGTQRAAATSIAFSGVHDGFESEVGRVGVRRAATVGDRADRGGDTGADYDFDEHAGGHSGGERASRERAARDQIAARKHSMDRVYQARDPVEQQKAVVAGDLAPGGSPGKNMPLTLYPAKQYTEGRDGADKGWNYLMPVMVMSAAGTLETVYEHKVMREAVARYLIAVSQHMHTLTEKHDLRDPHLPTRRLGDLAGRSGDVMASSADASKLYGDPKDAAAAQSQRARTQFKEAKARAPDVKTAMRQLGHDLEAAMDKFFATAAPGERLKAIAFDICVKEFSLDEAIWQHVSAEALWEFAKQAMKIAGVFFALRHLGPPGQIISAALHKAFAAQNSAQFEGMAIQLAGWLEGATQCTNFNQARGWAFAFRSAAETVAQFVRDWVATSGGGAVGRAFGAAWQPSRREPRTVGEMRRELAPVNAATRREMATQLEANLRPALEQNRPLNADQLAMWSMLHAIDPRAATQLRANYKHLPAISETSPLTVGATISVHTPMRLAITEANVRAAVDAHLHSGQTIQPYRIEVLPEAEFARRFKTQKGRAAVTVVEDGHAVVYAREGVPPSAIADEAMHLLQLNDPSHPRLGESIRMLSEGTLEQWPTLDIETRKNLFERKLEVEIDAKHRRMAELRAGDPEYRNAQDQLRDLNALQARVQALKPADLLAMKASGNIPDYLRDPLWLFAKEKTIGGVNLQAPGVDLAKIERKVIHDSPAAKLKGHQVQQVGQPWTETTTVFASNSGKVTIDPSNPHEIAVAGRRYVLEDGALLSVKNQDWVGEGTLLATEPAAKYRLVEVKEGQGPVRERLEYFSAKRGGWVQAGEHSTRRGAMVEQAGRDQLTHKLDAELAAAKTSPNAQDPTRLHSYVRVQHQSARGHGFDDVIVEFRGDPPKATIRIVEIKDYPARYAQLGMMSAIRENLSQNMRALRKRLEEATDATDSGSRPEEFRALSEREVNALRQAVDLKEFQIELHVGPTTLVGSEARAGSMLAQLRHELMTSGEFGAQPGQVGKDVLAPAPTRITQDSVNRATNSSSDKKTP